MVTIQTYQLGDVEYLEHREGDLLGESPFEEEKGPTWTVLVDEYPVAIFGFMFISPGTYEMWAEITDAIRGNGRPAIKQGREIIELAFENLEMHRLQATCRVVKGEYSRFLEVMGFQKEGLLRQAAPNREDLILYSRVKG